MIPIIGIMIAAYVFTRCAEMIARAVADELKGGWLVIVLCVGCALVQVLGAVILLGSGLSPGP